MELSSISTLGWKKKGNASGFFPPFVPVSADFQEPYAVVVLLEKDLVVIDLAQNGYVLRILWCLSHDDHGNQTSEKGINASGVLCLFVCLFFHSYPIFENPYPLTIHESPVTCCEYVADCPVDLIPALYSVGSRQKRQGYSKKVGSVKSEGE